MQESFLVTMSALLKNFYSNICLVNYNKDLSQISGCCTFIYLSDKFYWRLLTFKLNPCESL